MLRREVEKSQQLSGKLILRIRAGALLPTANGKRSGTGTPSIDAGDELVCTVEFDGKSSTCTSLVRSASKDQASPLECALSSKDAVVDVAEYHGGSGIKISITASRSRKVGRRSSRFLKLLTSREFSKGKLHRSANSTKPIVETIIPLREALPKAQRNLVRQIADSYEAGSARPSFMTSSASKTNKVTLSSAPSSASSTLSDKEAFSAVKFLHSAGVEAGWWNGYGGHPPEDWKDYWPSFTISIPGAGSVDVSLLFVPIIPPDKAMGGFTELHKAAYIGDARLASVLLGPRCGANTHYRTRDALGLTALDIAALKGHLEVALEIIADSAQISWNGSYQSTMDKRTSLHYAVLGGNPLVVACLADHYGNSMYTTVRRGNSISSHSALTSGTQEVPSDDESTSRCLVIDVEDENGWTPLMMACERPDMAEAVSRLVEAGANLELVTKTGDTALIIACREGNVECAMALLDAKAPNAPPDSKASPARPNRANYAGDRALDRAAGAKSCPELIRTLLDACAVPGLRRHDGSTALHVAARAGFMENCKVLVEWLERERDAMAQSQASLGHYVGSAVAQSLNFLLVKDAYGRLASEIANEEGHEELAKWLKQVEEKEAMRVAQAESDRPVLDDDQVYDYYKQHGEEEKANAGDEES